MCVRPSVGISVLISTLIALATSGSARISSEQHPDAADAWGKRFTTRRAQLRRQPRRGPRVDVVRRWNEIALDANALDHTPPDAGTRTFGEQLGPGRTARALAIVHIAIFDAANSVARRYTPYTPPPPTPARASMRTAVAQAAHDTLTALYPTQVAIFDAALDEDLAAGGDPVAKANGIVLGKNVAGAVLTLRAGDGADVPDPRIGTGFTPSDQPGFWRQDPISRVPLAVGAFWSEVKPFALPSNGYFSHEPPPDMASEAYATAFNEVKRLGGDGVTTPTERTADQTIAGIYWGYDGTPGLGTPPRLYNQIAVQIADERRTDAVDLARLLALVNVGMADASVVGWYEKYLFQLWRPVTGIREADPGTGSSGLGDGNTATIGDPTFTPLGAPASNLLGPNFTPPFPAYPSGHALFGSVLFQMLRRVYGSDAIRFTFVSDEYNGTTVDNTGTTRPRLPRTFDSLSEAETENGRSRVFLGIHWEFDRTRGQDMGRKTADYVFEHFFTPSSASRRQGPVGR